MRKKLRGEIHGKIIIQIDIDTIVAGCAAEYADIAVRLKMLGDLVLRNSQGTPVLYGASLLSGRDGNDREPTINEGSCRLASR